MHSIGRFYCQQELHSIEAKVSCVDVDECLTVHVCKLFNVFSNYVTRKLRIYVYSSISRMITYLRVLQMIKHANKSLSWVKSVENTAISANEAASYLIAKTRSLQCISVYHLYTTLVLPVIEYSSFTWGLRPFDLKFRIT